MFESWYCCVARTGLEVTYLFLPSCRYLKYTNLDNGLVEYKTSYETLKKCVFSFIQETWLPRFFFSAMTLQNVVIKY